MPRVTCGTRASQIMKTVATANELYHRPAPLSILHVSWYSSHNSTPKAGGAMIFISWIRELEA